jgi:hypothetical protein
LRTALATQEDGDVINLGSNITLSGDLPVIQNCASIGATRCPMAGIAPLVAGYWRRGESGVMAG